MQKEGFISANGAMSEYHLLKKQVIDIVNSGKITLYNKYGLELDIVNEIKKLQDYYEEHEPIYDDRYEPIKPGEKIIGWTEVITSEEDIANDEIDIKWDFIAERYFFSASEFTKEIHKSYELDSNVTIINETGNDVPSSNTHLNTKINVTVPSKFVNSLPHKKDFKYVITMGNDKEKKALIGQINSMIASDIPKPVIAHIMHSIQKY